MPHDQVHHQALPHQPMPHMICQQLDEGWIWTNMLGWAVPFLEGQPFPVAPLGVEPSSACVLKAKAYGQARVRAPGAV